MKFVDEETRALVRNARLDALEADNYGVDVEADADAAADELYVDDDGAEVDAKKMPKGRRRAATSRANKFKVKSLAQLVFEEVGGAGRVLNWGDSSRCVDGVGCVSSAPTLATWWILQQTPNPTT